MTIHILLPQRVTKDYINYGMSTVSGVLSATSKIELRENCLQLQHCLRIQLDMLK